jgi:hypothetical protein
MPRALNPEKTWNPGGVPDRAPALLQDEYSGIEELAFLKRVPEWDFFPNGTPREMMTNIKQKIQ